MRGESKERESKEREIEERFPPSSPGSANVNRRDALKVLGIGAFGAPIAAALHAPAALAANTAPAQPQPITGSVDHLEGEHEKAGNPFNPCGKPRRAQHFTGPFPTNYTTYMVNSPNQPHDLPLRVLLPDKLETIASPRVLYVLPDMPGIVRDDGLLSVLEADLHNKYGLIAVSPSFSDWPWYADNPRNPKIRQETYFVNEIVPFIDKVYPKASKVRLLVGMSKSGNGAFQLLLRHPDVFHAAAIFDSPLMANSATQFQAVDIYGDNENFMKNYCVPQLLLERAELLRGKPPRFAILGYSLFGGPNAMHGPHLQEAHAFMESLGIRHIYQSNTCRDHLYGSGWLEGAVAALDKMSRS
ncbi:MAG: alpha/beta hydrolase-fold protein [Acidobacteriaceae bacterium]